MNRATMLVLAVSDRASYLGVDSEDDFCVFTVLGQSETRVGDLLLYRSEGFDGRVVNRTRGDELRINFELTTSSLSEAIDFLVVFRQPESIETSRATYSAESSDVASRIRDELFP